MTTAPGLNRYHHLIISGLGHRSGRDSNLLVCFGHEFATENRKFACSFPRLVQGKNSIVTLKVDILQTVCRITGIGQRHAKYRPIQAARHQQFFRGSGKHFFTAYARGNRALWSDGNAIDGARATNQIIASVVEGICIGRVYLVVEYKICNVILPVLPGDDSDFQRPILVHVFNELLLLAVPITIAV